MITTQMTGGMGNQMFIYAMGLAQARRFKTKLGLDMHRFERDPLRRYCLDLWRGVEDIRCSATHPTVTEAGMPYNQEVVNRINQNSRLRGYWQTEKYFAHIRQELLDIFQPKWPFTPYTSDLIVQISQEGRRSAALGVRRCEYLSERNQMLYGSMGMDYYLNACKRVAANTPDPHFFVFSDDAEWCKQNFKLPYRFTVVNNIQSRHPITGMSREDEHLWPMRHCHHAIIPNSTFSWWGAWLSPVPDNDRVVIAPHKWFAGMPDDPRDVIPERWVKI